MCDDGMALFVQVKVSAEKWHCWWCVGGSAEISFARRRLRVVICASSFVRRRLRVVVCASLSSFPCANLPVDNGRRVVHTASGGRRAGVGRALGDGAGHLPLGGIILAPCLISTTSLATDCLQLVVSTAVVFRCRFDLGLPPLFG